MNVTVQQVWDEIPDVIKNGICGDIGVALRIAGHPLMSREALGRIIEELIDQVRAGSTGPLTRDQKSQLQIAVWQWCIDTAKGGLSA